MFGIILAHSVRLFLDSWPTCAVMSWIPVPGGWRRLSLCAATLRMLQ